jgi:hypothetical protein
MGIQTLIGRKWSPTNMKFNKLTWWKFEDLELDVEVFKSQIGVGILEISRIIQTHFNKRRRLHVTS